jgi:hypothetical protein
MEYDGGVVLTKITFDSTVEIPQIFSWYPLPLTLTEAAIKPPS